MPNFRPGRSDGSFIDRCIKPHLHSVVKCIGDDVIIDGQSACVYWSPENDKDDEGFVQMRNSSLEMCWPCNSPFSVRANSEVIRKGIVYSVRNDPENQEDGWMCASLKKCGTC